jgi:hypothetical protein
MNLAAASDAYLKRLFICLAEPLFKLISSLMILFLRPFSCWFRRLFELVCLLTLVAVHKYRLVFFPNRRCVCFDPENEPSLWFELASQPWTRVNSIFKRY